MPDDGPYPVPDAYRGTASPGLEPREPPEGSGRNYQIPSIYAAENKPPPAAPEPARPPGIMSRAGLLFGTAADAIGGVARHITGEGRSQYPDMPNLFETTDRIAMDPLGSLPLLVGYALNARPDQLQQLAQKAMPGSQVFADNQGNPIIRHDGKSYYISKPGLRLQDLAGTFGEGAVQALAAAWAMRFPGIGGMSPGAIRTATIAGVQGMTQGLTKAGQGEVVRQVGGGTGSDPFEVALAAAGGAAGSLVESTARAVFGRLKGEGTLLFRGMAGMPGDTVLTPANLTAQGRTLLDGIVTPGQLTVAQAQQIQRTLGHVTAEAGRQRGRGTVDRAVQSAREGIPMTAGQLTGNPEQLGLEDQMRHGPGSVVMDAMKTTQEEALTRAAAARIPGSGSPMAALPPNPAAPAVAPRAAGAGAPSRFELGSAMEQRLRDRGAELAAAETHAWSGLQRATPAGEQTVPNGLAFHDELATRFRARRAIDRLEETPPLPDGRVQQAERLMDEALFAADAQGQRTVPNGIDLGRFKQLRQTLGRMAADTNSAEERRTIQRMLRGLDDVTNQTVADGMISGDANRLTQLRDAMRVSREEFAFWGPDNPRAAKFMADLQAGNLEGEQVYTALFGAGRLNARGPANQIIDHLRREFGENSALWGDVQKAAVRSMLFGETDDAFKPQRMIAEIDKALEGAGAGILAKLGIPPDHLRELQRAAQTLMQSATKNPSGTAGAGLEKLRALVGGIPFAKSLLDNSLQVAARARLATGAGQGARLGPSHFAPGERIPRSGVGLLGASTGAAVAPGTGDYVFDRPGRGRYD